MTIVTMMDYVDAVEEEIVEAWKMPTNDHEHTHVLCGGGPRSRANAG